MASFSPSIPSCHLKSAFLGDRSGICCTAVPVSRIAFFARPVECKESRIGKKPIEVPSNVAISLEGQGLKVKGPLGELSRTYPREVKVLKEESGQLKVVKALDTRRANQMHGLFRTLTDNMVVGVSKGFEKRLQLVGVGYRAMLEGKDLVLNLGFSHPVRMAIPDGLQVKVEDNTRIAVSGYDKCAIGEFAASVRGRNKPKKGRLFALAALLPRTGHQLRLLPTRTPMDIRRRLPSSRPPRPAAALRIDASAAQARAKDPASPPLVRASDALPVPIRHTNMVFFPLFFLAAYYLMNRWREKVRIGAPLHVLNLLDMAAIVALVSSLIYLLSFFGIELIQPFLGPRGADDDFIPAEDAPEDAQCPTLCSEVAPARAPLPPPRMAAVVAAALPVPAEDEEIVQAVLDGAIPSYSLEARLGDCRRAAGVRREALRRATGRSLEGLPLDGFDYQSILGQCCEMPVGYVTLPVGIAGPMLLDGKLYHVPMATTEGCLVASTNRGLKAIKDSGGADSVILRDGITRAPAVRFASAKRAAELRMYLEDPVNFDTLSVVFNKSSRFAKLQGIQCAMAGKNLYIRFSCGTGDAMGMNMVSKGVQNVLDFLQSDFPDMDIISISGNFCSDKKPAAVNWIEGRGKSVVCEAVIKEEVVNKVLKSTVPALVELNMIKNLAGSAVAGALGGFNAHASNIVAAIFIATGQDPAQNVESSHCITMMEAVNGGKDLHVSVTMPSIEVGTVGGGTQLAPQAALLDLLGVKGANMDSPGDNARLLATVVAGAVLGGELSLMSALAAGQLVRSHMKYNRSSRDVTKTTF